MSCKINPFNSTILFNSSTNKYSRIRKTVPFASTYKQNQQKLSTTSDKVPEPEKYTISFNTQRECRLGISRYPDFKYNAEGGVGTGVGKKVKDEEGRDLFVSFDLETLYIPPLTSSTTKFLGLPMPPFLKIDIVPEEFQGIINPESGKFLFQNNQTIDASCNVLFSVGSIYRAPPLLVKTVLTSEESNGRMRSGRGNRLDKEGKCRLVGVATVDPIDDFLMNSFLGLPTECLAILNAVISIGKD